MGAAEKRTNGSKRERGIRGGAQQEQNIGCIMCECVDRAEKTGARTSRLPYQEIDPPDSDERKAYCYFFLP